MKKIFLMIALFTTAFAVQAATKNDVTMPDTFKVGASELVLNGLGTRKATWLRVKVYVGGLYIKSKTQNANEVLNQPYPKYINMHFVRDVSGEKLIGGWNEAFNNALSGNTTKVKSQIDQFNALMGDIEKNQEILITFLKDGVEVAFAGKAKKKVKGGDFSRALLSVWFINAADEGLRDGLLGK